MTLNEFNIFMQLFDPIAWDMLINVKDQKEAIANILNIIDREQFIKTYRIKDYDLVVTLNYIIQEISRILEYVNSVKLDYPQEDKSKWSKEQKSEDSLKKTKMKLLKQSFKEEYAFDNIIIDIGLMAKFVSEKLLFNIDDWNLIRILRIYFNMQSKGIV